MRRARALVLSGTVALGAFGAFSAAAGAAQSPPEPVVALSTQNVEPGQTVTISGEHWPDGSILQASLCGNRALDGSANCVQDTAVTMTPGPDGALSKALQVTTPPVPCPCVIFVNLLASERQLRLPLQVVGAPVAPVMRHLPPKATKSISADATVESVSSFGAFFGGAADRTLVLELHNKANVAVFRIPVVAAWGKDDANHPIPSRLVTIPARRTITVRLPFQLDPLSIGGFEVAGRAGIAGNQVRFASHTPQWPWGLLGVLVLVVVGIIVLVVVALLRRRLRRAQEPGTAVTTSDAPIAWSASGGGTGAPGGASGGAPGAQSEMMH